MGEGIRYVLMDPSGNRTILVETEVPVQLQPAVASKLMEMEPTAEQTGFLRTSSAETGPVSADIQVFLRMAGGEFCGNASMSAAVWYCMQQGVREGQLKLSVSGASEPVEVSVKSLPDGTWKGSVSMPGPSRIETVSFSEEYCFPVVTFPGISHVIVEKEVPKERAEDLVRQWCSFLGTDALGIMFLDRIRSVLTPLVYVPAVNTLFWESACGSGTTAIGAWLAAKSGSEINLSLRQPGGVMEISAEKNGTLRLGGTVRVVGEGSC